MIDTGLKIDSPEGVSFTYELASLADRGKAYGIDLLIRIAVVAVVGALFALLLGMATIAGVGVWMVLYFAVEWGYYVLFELVWDGQSPGKRLFALRVVKASGHPIGFYESVLRNLLRAADQLPFTYAAGAISVFASARFQRLGDLAAGTVVVHDRQSWFVGQWPRVDLDAGDSALRRVTLSNRERRLLQEFVLRKDWLHPARREQLASILADGYRRRFGRLLAAGAGDDGSASALLSRLYAASIKEELGHEGGA